MKKDSLILALDLEDLSQVKKFLRPLKNTLSFCKVGLRLFTREGPKVISWLKENQFKIFLDLKFHDIPNTVAQSVESATALGVDILSIHAMGGPEMIRAAVQSAKKSGRAFKKKAPKIFVVTVLTSMDDLSFLGSSLSIPDQVLSFARLAKECGADGIICSPQEITSIRKLVGPQMKILTPGIRWGDAAMGDQKRTATPEQAIKEGSNFLVIGRPILKARDPQKIVREILKGSAR